MPVDPLNRIVSQIHDAALEPRLWPAVLQSLTDATGAIGAAYIVRNTQTGRVDWANFSGPSTEFRSDYVTHFSALDPFPGLFEGNEATWMRLSESLPAQALRQSGWYNDFVLKCGVGEIVGAQISNTGSHTVVFGIHEAIGGKPLRPQLAKRVDELLEPLAKAAEVQLKLRQLGWQSAVAVRALDQLLAGVIVADGNGWVTGMNGAAERIIRHGDGLVVRNGRLGALRVFEEAKLAASLASATKAEPAASSRVLLGRRGSMRHYMLTVTPLGVDLGFYTDPLALILVVDPEARSPRVSDLSAYFGLSPAEGRLAVLLMSGKQLRAISSDCGVAIPTLRSQLRSILRKVGVERQTDLLRLLASVPSLPTGATGPE